jgi:hypothetical protein
MLPPLPDLSLASRDQLLALIQQQYAMLVALTARVEELERKAKAGGPPRGMPGNKPTSAPPKPGTGSRKPRSLAFVRRRAVPTRVVQHAVAQCPDCGTPLRGGWIQRRREVIDLPPVAAETVEHQFIARTCAECQTRVTPNADVLTGVVVGRQRVGVRLLSLIVTLREVCRLPLAQIRLLLRTLYRLDLSEGAIVAASHQLAAAGAEELAAIQQAIQTDAVVHADETGWRENGQNGYVWTLSTPTARFFLRGDRSAATFAGILGPAFAGTLVTDFYGVYTAYPGLHQYCWAHLLREIHDLRAAWAALPALTTWAHGVHAVYRAGVEMAGRALSPPVRQQIRDRLERTLLTLCQPALTDPTAPHATLARRITTYVAELLTFVADPTVPPDNNAAERSLRPLVVARKISGGTRSPRGSATRMALASLFGTWQLRGADPLSSATRLLISPHA